MGNIIIDCCSTICSNVFYLCTCGCCRGVPRCECCYTNCQTFWYELYRSAPCIGRPQRKDTGQGRSGFRDNYADAPCAYNDDFTIDTVCFQPGEPMITPPGPLVTDLYNQEHGVPPGGKTIYKQPLSVDLLEQQQKLNTENSENSVHWYPLVIYLLPPGPLVTDMYNQEHGVPPGGKTIYKQPLSVDLLEQQQKLNMEHNENNVNWYTATPSCGTPEYALLWQICLIRNVACHLAGKPHTRSHWVWHYWTINSYTDTLLCVTMPPSGHF